MKDAILSFSDLQQETVETAKPKTKKKSAKKDNTECVMDDTLEECPKKTSKKLEEKYKKLNDKLDLTIQKLTKGI
jgi:hypothetical protein